METNEVSKRIYTLRGSQIMFDSDLAEIYKIETRILKRAVRRNAERFPDDFMFEVTKEELENLRSQIGISSSENHSKADARPILRSQSGISSLEQSLEPPGKAILRSQFGISSSGTCAGGRVRPNLRSRIRISSFSDSFSHHGGSRYAPFAFTELGVAMLSAVLETDKAIQISIGVIRAFVQLRKQRSGCATSKSTNLQVDLFPRVESLENKFETLAQKFDRFEVKHQDRVEKSNLMAGDRVGAIQHVVARRFGLKVADLKSATRTRAISIPRQIAIYLLRTHLCMGFSEIGQHFGRRDHTTILHAYHKIHMESDNDNMIRKAIQSLQNEIQSVLL